MRSAVTVCLVPEARQGPFVYHADLAAACADAAALGFEAIEIFARSVEDLDARELKALLQRHELRLAALGTGAGWLVHKLSLTSADATTRRRAADFIGAVIDFAGGFGAPAIIGSMQGRHEGGVTREQAMGWLTEALDQLGPRARAAGAPLLFEPLNRYETNLLNRVGETAAFLKPLRTQNVKILCDLFHMNIEEVCLAEALRVAGPLVGHVHFADSNRQAVGFGHTDARPIVEALRDIGYEGFLSAEIFPLPDGHAAAAQTIQAFRAVTAGS